MTQKDLTKTPDLIHVSGTGPISAQRPRYKNLLPPCNAACPAGENIQKWLAFVEAKEYELAWRRLTEVNPMAAIHGRVCYHPCEQGCNRNEVDEPVSIHAVERFLGDMAIEKGWQFEVDALATSQRILIVGSGPAGLSAAYHLSRKGHSVEIYEAADKAGGMLRYGIPEYRLPRTVLDAEIKRIEQMGVKIHLTRRVDNVLEEKKLGFFDAVFVAIGAHIGTKVDIPSRDATKILDAVTYLKAIESGTAPMLGRRVAVYGGGNTAMDAARTAKRMGAEEALIIYRRDRDHMPAHEFEVRDAEDEGIKINWLRTIKGVEEEGIRVEKMLLDGNGRPQPSGEFEMLEADSVILALGQGIEAELFGHIDEVIVTKGGIVEVNEDFMTGYPGLFAGGDMTPGTRSVTYATGHGRKAAAHIHGWLNERIYHKPPSPPIVGYEELHLWYHTDASSKEQNELKPLERVQNFDEVLEGLSEEESVFEATRCYACGNCFECDGCFGACPENAVEILGKDRGYRIDYDRCTGCGACVGQCPTHAMTMISATEAL